MRINEVVQQVPLTRRAVKFYEEKGLLHVPKDSNGYRNYTEEHIRILQEICAYRKLGIGLEDIRKLLLSNDTELLKQIYEQKRSELDASKKELEALEEFLRTRDAKTFCSSLDYHSIAQAIQDALPGFYGYYFMNHFLPYLQMPITTPEQEQAFHKIVEFWDHTTLRIPLLLRFSGWLNWRLSSKACLQKTLEQTEQRTQKYLNLTEEEYQALKEQTLKNVKLRNHPLVKYHPFFIAHRRFMRKLQDCGYNDIFLPNMMALSPEYKAYHDALDKINQRICEDLGLYYDSKFQLVLKK